MQATLEPSVRVLPLHEQDIPDLVKLARDIWYRHFPSIISFEQIEYILAQRYGPALIRELQRARGGAGRYRRRVHDGRLRDVQGHRARSMRLKFTKMQGVGNDFVVIDAVNQRVRLDAPTARRLADRHFGVGCDQILLIEPPRRADTDFYYRIFNSDGNEVQHCGNGARCFLRYVREKGLTNKDAIRVETLSGVIVPRLEPDGRVTVDMGPPQFEPARIPFIAERQALTYWVEVDSQPVEISALSMGNPHAVQIVDDVQAAPVLTQGPLIERHPRFPEGANAGYMQVVNRGHIRLRVYERGAGETLACGTGACAAVVAGITRGDLDSRVRVTTHGGDLSIAWAGDRQPVLMTGPAESVFEGEIEL